MDPYLTLKLPEALEEQLEEQLEIHIWNETGFGDLRIQQQKPYWDNTKKKWMVNVFLKPDDLLKLRDGA